METLTCGVVAVRRSYAFVISHIAARPAVTFWLIVAYVAIRR